MNIVFIHKSIGHDHDAEIQTAVDCARLHSPESNVVVLRDPVSPLAESYEKIFNWLGSANQKEFELACLVRWIWLLDYMQREHLSEAFHCDCDMLLFQDMEQERNMWLKKFDYTLNTNPTNGLPHAASSYVTLPLLEALVKFMFERQGREMHDMLLWKEFWQEHSEFKCGEMNEIRDGAVYDHNLGDTEYMYEQCPIYPANDAAWPNYPKKLVNWNKGKPYFQVKESGELVRAKSLHCWAAIKTKMRELVEMSKASMTKENP
jgi:hypothetical protein